MDLAIHVAVFLYAVGSILGLILSGGSDQPFTDVMSTSKSPDGQITAAFVIEARGPMAGVAYGITLSPTGSDPRDGSIVLREGEDDRELVYRWADNQTLVVRLPCGWWADLTNHYQLPGTSRIIDVKYEPPQGCTPQLPGSVPIDPEGAH